MKKAKGTTPMFMYRVIAFDKADRELPHLAMVRADQDETARRKIIHTVMREGGRVKRIDATTDQQRYKGEAPPRAYD